MNYDLSPQNVVIGNVLHDTFMKPNSPFLDKLQSENSNSSTHENKMMHNDSKSSLDYSSTSEDEDIFQYENDDDSENIGFDTQTFLNVGSSLLSLQEEDDEEK